MHLWVLFYWIYGGFINAGIGFVIILFLNNVIGLSLIKTNATKVALVFIYICGALALLLGTDTVDWSMGLFSFRNFIGAWWSSRWSVDKGEAVIKIAMVIMVSVCR